MPQDLDELNEEIEKVFASLRNVRCRVRELTMELAEMATEANRLKQEVEEVDEDERT